MATSLASRWGMLGVQVGALWDEFLEDLTYTKFDFRCLDKFFVGVFKLELFKLELSVFFVMCVSFLFSSFLFSFSSFVEGGRGGGGY